MNDSLGKFAGYNDSIYIIYDGWIPIGSNNSSLGIYSSDIEDFEIIYRDENSIDFLTIDDLDGTYYYSRDGKIYLKIFLMKDSYEDRDEFIIFRINYDGTGYEQITDQKFSMAKGNDIVTIKDDYLYYTHRENAESNYQFIRKDLKTDKDEILFETKNLLLYGIKEKNGYLYLSTITTDSRGNIVEDGNYYRMKLDGTELTKSETPFEWRY